MSVLVAGGSALYLGDRHNAGFRWRCHGESWREEKTKQRGTCIPFSSAGRAAFKALVCLMYQLLDGGGAPTQGNQWYLPS